MAGTGCRHAPPRTAILATDFMQSVLFTLKASGAALRAYAPYGHSAEEDLGLSPLGFNGERREPLTHHYSLGNGHRVLNPVTMRFNTSDVLSPFGAGGVNAYAYCANDPINRSDPTGRISVRWGLIKRNVSKLAAQGRAPEKLASQRRAAKRSAPEEYSMPARDDFAWRPPREAGPPFGPENHPLNDLDNYFKLKSRSLFYYSSKSVDNDPRTQAILEASVIKRHDIQGSIGPLFTKYYKSLDLAKLERFRMDRSSLEFIKGSVFERQMPSDVQDIIRRL